MPPAQLSALSSINEEAEWLGRMIQCWADEEWAAVELRSIHAELGAAAGQVRTGESVFELRAGCVRQEMRQDGAVRRPPCTAFTLPTGGLPCSTLPYPTLHNHHAAAAAHGAPHARHSQRPTTSGCPWRPPCRPTCACGSEGIQRTWETLCWAWPLSS